jgi:hypothetical protein
MVRHSDEDPMKTRQIHARFGNQGGQAGPWASLLPELKTKPGTEINVLLTDKFPNAKAFDRTAQLLGSSINCQSNSISAFDVPAEIKGLRTYSTEELQALVDSLPDNNYCWEIGEIKTRKVQPLTYLIGYLQV